MTNHYQDEYLPVVDSTNRRARELAERGAAHGSGVRADQQTAGRGRLDRTWFSPAGRNLYCSYILRPTLDPEFYPRLTMVAGLAVALLLDRYAPGLVGLKWPNDVLVAGKKCGGILCESFVARNDDGKRFVIVGIGLNLNMTANELPPCLHEIATSLVREGLPPMKPGEVFASLREQLLEGVRDFECHGFQNVLRHWRKYDVLAGKRTSWVSQSGAVVSGISLGPGEDGLLRIRDDHGIIHTVVSGDISRAQQGA